MPCWGPSPATSPGGTHPQLIKHVHASLPLLRPRAQILHTGLQAQAFLRAHRAHEAQGAQKGNPHTYRAPQPATPLGTQVRSPFGAGITSISVLLALVLLAVELLMDHSEGGEKVAEEEEEEGEATHEHLQGPGKPGSGQAGHDGLSHAPLPEPWLTCHSLHSGSRAKLNNVSALKSCQNCEGGSLSAHVRWGSETEVDTQGVDGDTQV